MQQSVYFLNSAIKNNSLVRETWNLPLYCGTGRVVFRLVFAEKERNLVAFQLEEGKEVAVFLVQQSHKAISEKKIKRSLFEISADVKL